VEVLNSWIDADRAQIFGRRDDQRLPWNFAMNQPIDVIVRIKIRRPRVDEQSRLGHRRRNQNRQRYHAKARQLAQSHAIPQMRIEPNVPHSLRNCDDFVIKILKTS
jgi:hypothetical protein